MRTQTMMTMTLLLAAMTAADRAEAQLHGQASASAAATVASRTQAGPRPDAASQPGSTGEGSLDAEAVVSEDTIVPPTAD